MASTGCGCVDHRPNTAALNLLSPRDPGTGALPQHLAGNSIK